MPMLIMELFPVKSAGFDYARGFRVIEKGSRNWKARRHKKLEQLAPSFAARGFKKAAEKLVSALC